MERIFIVGGPGSGKTTIARKIAAAIPAPLHELDTIGYRGGAGAKRPLPEKLDEIAAIATSDAWVAEGMFIGWTERLAERAEIIVWLNIPWRVAAWRMVRRHALASLAGTNRHRGLRKLWRFTWDSRGYYHDHRPQPRALDDDAAVSRGATERWLHPYRGKVVQCRTRRDVSRLSATVRQD